MPISLYHRCKLRREGRPVTAPQLGILWNVYGGPRLLGIVNEPDFASAGRAACREWPFLYVFLIRATEDPARRRDLVRPHMIPGVQ